MFSTLWYALGILSSIELGHGLDIQSPWDIDFTSKPDEDMNTCRDYKDKIEQAYNQVGEIVSSTLTNLEDLRYARPEADEVVTFARDLWDLSDRTLQAFFGISVNPNDPQIGMWWEKVHDVFTPMDMTLQHNANPAKYQSTLKPAIACGTKGWRYIAPDQPDPEDPEKKPLRDTKDPKKASLFKETGAWYWKHRYLWIPKGRDGKGSTEKELNLCTGARGVTLVQDDLITICDSALGEQATLDWLSIPKGTHLDDITGNILSYNLLHEFAHFFGARGNPSLPGWPNGKGDRAVIDPQAVNFNRQPLYVPPGNPDGSTPHPGTSENPNKILLASILTIGTGLGMGLQIGGEEVTEVGRAL
ncbi:hypothetical protein GGR51DRAFT_556054 [Nemania sp. FL0031]|nr:hypothetical protein GGR51DRAFT_556054 [Nemania sp. FL0031]